MGETKIKKHKSNSEYDDFEANILMINAHMNLIDLPNSTITIEEASKYLKEIKGKFDMAKRSLSDGQVVDKRFVEHMSKFEKTFENTLKLYAIYEEAVTKMMAAGRLHDYISVVLGKKPSYIA